MSKFKDLYNQICENIESGEKYAYVIFKGSVEKCPLNIKNTMKSIFKNYVLSDRFLYNHLKVVVNLDDNLVNVNFENPSGGAIPHTIHISKYAPDPASAEAREVFNDLAQRFIDWCDTENITLEDFSKDDNPANRNFNLFLVSNAFVSAIVNK